MKRKNLIIIVMALLILGCAVLLFCNNTKESKRVPQAPVNNGELITSSKEGCNSIEVYGQENQLVVNAESEADFFDGVQFIVEIEGEIAPKDIEIIWMTVGGNTEQAEENDRIIAEIKISDNDELICDKKINFTKKAFDAVEDVLEIAQPRNSNSIIIKFIHEECASKVQVPTSEEIKKLFFGEWKVSKLLGFSKIGNDYTNYPDGHDIIGDHIIINENVFSSEGLENYERYQCEVLNPTYDVSYIKYKYLIYSENEALKEDPELYKMVRDEELQDLEIIGIRDGRRNYPPPVQIMISNNRQLIILTMDGAYYLLEKIQ